MGQVCYFLAASPTCSLRQVLCRMFALAALASSRLNHQLAVLPTWPPPPRHSLHGGDDNRILIMLSTGISHILLAHCDRNATYIPGRSIGSQTVAPASNYSLKPWIYSAFKVDYLRKLHAATELLKHTADAPGCCVRSPGACPGLGCCLRCQPACLPFRLSLSGLRGRVHGGTLPPS
jgi:hypothetical protein